MAHGRIPAWIYEPLPYVYLAAGGFALGTLHSAPGIVSGLLLGSAGLIIIQQRRDYRARLKRLARLEEQALSETETRQPPTRHAAFEFTWQPQFEVGNALIDRQHRRLFGLGNELIDAIVSKKSAADIELMMDDLVIELETHFESEEEIMRQAGYPLSQAHREIHRDLLARVRNLRDRFQAGLLPAQDLIGFITYDVVTQHITKEDLKFAGQVVGADGSS